MIARAAGDHTLVTSPRMASQAFVHVRLALAALYSGYVALMVPSVAVPVLAMAVGLGALVVFDAQRVAWCAAHALVLAVLHVRSLAVGAPHEAIQLGLAAFVAASALMTLLPLSSRAPRWGVVLLASAGVVFGPSAIVGSILAALRPLSVMEVIAVGRTDDRWLVWSPMRGAR